ncbi:MAG TPA: hypothetical protein VHV27_04765 [Phenylobacterium sp.]|nr:hypothetical protein [Phenylobacterium sp.]
MKVLRWLLALAVAGYGLAGLLPMLATALFKLGLGLGSAGERAALIMQATAWWQLIAELGVVVMLGLAAWRLARGRHAFGLALLAFAANAALWWILHAMPAYQLAFTPGELAADYYSLGGMLALLLAIWLTERSPSDHAAA